MTAVAVFPHRPTAGELLERRLRAGWTPMASRLREGHRVLGYAACVFESGRIRAYPDAAARGPGGTSAVEGSPVDRPSPRSSSLPSHRQAPVTGPSWRSRLLSLGLRAVVRRRSWGPGPALARRARRLFGAPPLYRSLVAWGVEREPVADTIVRGEWLTPRDPLPGVVLYVHGGGFVSCSAATHRPIAAALARRSRRRVLSIDYRLAPEHPFPAAAEDVLLAYDGLRSSRPGAVALAGDSAGGNLVLGLALRVRDTMRAPPACVVAFSPWTDLTGSGASARSHDGRDAMFRTENLAEFADAYLAGAPAGSAEASPLFADPAGLPPVLLHVGSSELLLDDARRLHERIVAAGGESRLEVFPDAPHGWQMLTPFLPEATASLARAGDFLATHLGGSPR